jgi:VanZ family protein
VTTDLGPIEDVDVMPQQDKVLHFLEYLVLAFLTAFALVRGTRRSREWRWRTATVLPALYGIALEVIQLGVPGREMSLLDAGANVLGAMAGAGIGMSVLEPVTGHMDRGDGGEGS